MSRDPYSRLVPPTGIEPATFGTGNLNRLRPPSAIFYKIRVITRFDGVLTTCECIRIQPYSRGMLSECCHGCRGRARRYTY